MKKTFIFLILFFLLFVFTIPATFSSELYFIDAHSQVDYEVEDLDIIIERMDQTGVYRTILAARRQVSGNKVVEFSRAYPDRILPAMKTKGSVYKLNKQKYYDRLNKDNKSRSFKAIAEILLCHAKKSDADEVIVYMDDKRVKAALEVALENGWPFIMHIEFEGCPQTIKHYFKEGLENILKSYPEHPFILIHMAQLESEDVRKLIQEHKNIYFMTSHADPIMMQLSNQPWIDMFDDNILNQEWRKLMIQYPDRFIFAIDNVWADDWHNNYLYRMKYWKSALSDLPDEVAHAIAHGNAERLWNIPPKVNK